MMCTKACKINLKINKLDQNSQVLCYKMDSNFTPSESKPTAATQFDLEANARLRLRLHRGCLHACTCTEQSLYGETATNVLQIGSLRGRGTSPQKITEAFDWDYFFLGAAHATRGTLLSFSPSPPQGRPNFPSRARCTRASEHCFVFALPYRVTACNNAFFPPYQCFILSAINSESRQNCF